MVMMADDMTLDGDDGDEMILDRFPASLERQVGW